MSLNVTSEDDEISLDGGCECCILVASSQEVALLLQVYSLDDS